jgi:hypothetical protein
LSLILIKHYAIKAYKGILVLDFMLPPHFPQKLTRTSLAEFVQKQTAALACPVTSGKIIPRCTLNLEKLIGVQLIKKFPALTKFVD